MWKEVGSARKLQGKSSQRSFSVPVSACQRWLWMWVVLRKKTSLICSNGSGGWKILYIDSNIIECLGFGTSTVNTYLHLIETYWDFKKGYPEINAFKAVLPTVEDILLLLLYFGRCIIAAWFHNLPPRWTLQKWKTSGNRTTISWWWNADDDDGIPTISSIRKPLEIEQEFPHYKSSSSKGILHQWHCMKSSWYVQPVLGFGVMPFWTSSMMPQARSIVTWTSVILSSDTSCSSQNKLFLYNLI